MLPASLKLRRSKKASLNEKGWNTLLAFWDCVRVGGNDKWVWKLG